ncbi:hypothetical protein CWI38_0568p0030 [Hamiltosporidium tvaerminnensis]|uniref:Uncharacterized protein n=1 Tax=Hamiltosporidium tvaerminnensis TaxID=1176355 RepID=A0A4Q9LX83_9MICR|nr:hypothetical protein CWI38_0568p0030 [Hamiltosporidium tvaerminnensis]
MIEEPTNNINKESDLEEETEVVKEFLNYNNIEDLAYGCEIISHQVYTLVDFSTN